jgi:hypothetical protein
MNMEIQFSDRAIAYLDILGFKDFLYDAEKIPDELNNLNSLVQNLSNSKLPTVQDPTQQFSTPIIDYLFIFDTIIISSPISQVIDDVNVDGLYVVSMVAIQIAQDLLEQGFLIRGGIAVGNVFHSTSNVYGSAYIEAYETEQKVQFPIIVLAESARKHISQKKNLIQNFFLADLFVTAAYLGDTVFLECLHPYGNSKSYILNFEDMFSPLKDQIIRNLKLHQPGTRKRSYWEWMATYFNYAIDFHSWNLKKIKLSQCPKPSFKMLTS